MDSLANKMVGRTLSVREFRALTEPKESLSTFFRSGPLFGVDLEIGRDRGDFGREIVL
ncbi:MAG: hypothetical protein ACP5OS_05585 [Leptospirillia bacterium]